MMFSDKNFYLISTKITKSNEFQLEIYITETTAVQKNVMKFKICREGSNSLKNI